MIAEDFHRSSAFHHIQFNQVGSFTATASEIGFTAQFKQLADLWNEYAAMSDEALLLTPSTQYFPSQTLSPTALSVRSYSTRSTSK